MIKVQQIVKPFNSGFSAVSIKYLLEDLQHRYVANISDFVKIKVIKEKDTYYVLLKLPSESNSKYPESNHIFYDVILELIPPNKNALNEDKLRDYDVKVFSNCPSFVYTFTYVYYKKGALINMPKGFYTRKAISSAPKSRNPLLLFGIEKTLWFSICYMDDRRLWKRDVLDSMVDEKTKLKDAIKEFNIVGQDQKLQEVEIRIRNFSGLVKENTKKNDNRKQKEKIKSDKKTKITNREIETLRSKLTSDLSSGLNSVKSKEDTLKSGLKTQNLKSNLSSSNKQKK